MKLVLTRGESKAQLRDQRNSARDARDEERARSLRVEDATRETLAQAWREVMRRRRKFPGLTNEYERGWRDALESILEPLTGETDFDDLP